MLIVKSFERMKWFALAALLLFDVPRTMAQAPAAGAPLQVGQVDVQRSRSFVFVGKTGFGHEHGAEGRLVSGSVILGAQQQAGQLVFDMKSFICDTPTARSAVGLEGAIDDSTQKETTANMLGAGVLDVARFPQATYTIRSALPFEKKQPTDPDWFQLDGDFTLHGVSRPLKIKVIAEQAPGFVHLRGQFALLQTQHGITPFSKAFGAVGVADELKVFGDLWISGR